MRNEPSLPIELLAVHHEQKKKTFSHPFCVFLYVLKGPVDISLGNESLTYAASDLLFLPPGRQFDLACGANGRLLLFGLSEDFFNDNIHINPLPLLSSQLSADADFLPLKRSLIHIAECFLSKGSAGPDSFTHEESLLIRSYLYQLLASLSKLLPHAAESVSRSSDRYLERVQEIADYIDRHYAQTLTLPDLANAFFLTPQYLSAFFHEHFGMNFKTYITKRRLHYARRDLRGNEVSISEVALKNGFTSVSTFQKNFQRYCGCTPSEYRSSQQQKKEGENRLLPLELPPDTFLPYPGISVNLPADQAPDEIPHVNCLINVGTVHNLLSERFRMHLGRFCASMHIRYVRITELLSNSFMPMILPHREYFYQNADIALTYFYENHLIPFVELTKLEERRSETYKLRSDFNYILRNDRFFKLLESFLKHVSRRWPISWLKEWKFEMYLLPKDNAASYINDFQRAARIIRTYIPGAAIGGPGLDLSVHSLSPEALLKEFKDRSFYPDFFSATLHYQLRRPDGSMTISNNPELLMDRCRELRKLLLKFDPPLPLYVTEWTSADPGSAPVAASRYQSAFIAKTWAALDEVCSLAGYSLFDNTEYIPGSQSPVLYQFGKGLFASGFLPYASYYAYGLCANLGSKVIAKGNCWRLVQPEENHYQLLVWHYVHFQTSTDPEVLEMTYFDKLYQIFEPAQPFHFRAVLTGLRPGLYHTLRTVLDEDHGSIFDVLIGEFRNSNIDRIAFLQNARTSSGTTNTHRAEITLPLERSRYTRIEEGSLTLSYELAPHTVCLWDIRRLI